MIIKTKNLVLRPYKTSDAKSLFNNFNSRKVTQFLCNAKYPYSLKAAKRWIIFCKNSEKKAPRKEIIWVIENDGEFLGAIGLKKIKNHKAELGFWLGEKYWNMGIMTEALSAVSDFGLNKLKLRRIYGYVFLKNKASARVFEKRGFKKEGLLRKDRIKDGKFVDVYLYAKVR
jgi:[ribosomal protein S5]-alanine N-acetyltransferase